MAPLRATAVAVLALVVAAATRLVRRALALEFLRHTLESPECLAERFDLAFVGGLLALRFFEEFQQFVELFQRVPQRGNDLHDFVDGPAHGRGLGWFEIARWTGGMSFLTAGWRRAFLSLGCLWLPWLVRFLHLWRRCIELLLVANAGVGFVLCGRFVRLCGSCCHLV
jgi:hypothetical protein